MMMMLSTFRRTASSLKRILGVPEIYYGGVKSFVNKPLVGFPRLAFDGDYTCLILFYSGGGIWLFLIFIADSVMR